MAIRSFEMNLSTQAVLEKYVRTPSASVFFNEEEQGKRLGIRFINLDGQFEEVYLNYEEILSSKKLSKLIKKLRPRHVCAPSYLLKLQDMSKQVLAILTKELLCKSIPDNMDVYSTEYRNMLAHFVCVSPVEIAVSAKLGSFYNKKEDDWNFEKIISQISMEILQHIKKKVDPSIEKLEIIIKEYPKLRLYQRFDTVLLRCCLSAYIGEATV